MSTILASWDYRALSLGLLLGFLLTAPAVAADRDADPVDRDADASALPLSFDRVQLHRNANRSVPYLPLARQGADPGEPMLRMEPVRTIELDGDPLANVYGGLRPIDVDGDGDFEFVHFNGYRYVQVWRADGRKLWRAEDRDGRTHNMESGTHRDIVVVTDVDEDGGQDVIHCWAKDGRRELVQRRGRDGEVLARVALGGGEREECQLAMFRTSGPAGTILLVAESGDEDGRSSCSRSFVTAWSRTTAYDLKFRRLWSRETCHAGHYVWPLDEGFDGRAEAIFVGKYLIRPDGSLQCSLRGWPEEDHVDGLAVADLLPDEPGLEAVAVGRTGTALYHAESCQPIWRIPTTVIRDPQHVAIAKLDPSTSAPLIQIDERGSVRGARSFVLNGRGNVVSVRDNDVMSMQNADLDGARGVDESVGGFGVVTDRHGNVRLDRNWYWNLRSARSGETKSGPYPTIYDRWQAFPLVFDYDRDGCDEIVQWGQRLIVVGKVVGGCGR